MQRHKTWRNQARGPAGYHLLLLLTFVLSLPLWFARGFRESAGFLFREDLDWIPSLGVRYSLGVDGIAALLILLTTLLSVISIYSSYTAVKTREKEYYVFLLLLETGMIGVFCALDFFLFYVFWEVMLVPMYFLIGVWGGPRKLYAAIKFFLYTLFGSVIMLLAIIAMYIKHVKGAILYGILQILDLLLEVDRILGAGKVFSAGHRIEVHLMQVGRSDLMPGRRKRLARGVEHRRVKASRLGMPIRHKYFHEPIPRCPEHWARALAVAAGHLAYLDCMSRQFAQIVQVDTGDNRSRIGKPTHQTGIGGRQTGHVRALTATGPQHGRVWLHGLPIWTW